MKSSSSCSITNDNEQNDKHIRDALHFAVGKICHAEEEEYGKMEDKPKISNEAIATITELTYHYATKCLSHDLIAFSQHANRRIINVEDVKLVARKNPRGILDSLSRFCETKSLRIVGTPVGKAPNSPEGSLSSKSHELAKKKKRSWKDMRDCNQPNGLDCSEGGAEEDSNNDNAIDEDENDPNNKLSQNVDNMGLTQQRDYHLQQMEDLSSDDSILLMNHKSNRNSKKKLQKIDDVKFQNKRNLDIKTNRHISKEASLKQRKQKNKIVGFDDSSLSSSEDCFDGTVIELNNEKNISAKSKSGIKNKVILDDSSTSSFSQYASSCKFQTHQEKLQSQTKDKGLSSEGGCNAEAVINLDDDSIQASE